MEKEFYEWLRKEAQWIKFDKFWTRKLYADGNTSAQSELNSKSRFFKVVLRL